VDENSAARMKTGKLDRNRNNNVRKNKSRRTIKKISEKVLSKITFSKADPYINLTTRDCSARLISKNKKSGRVLSSTSIASTHMP